VCGVSSPLLALSSTSTSFSLPRRRSFSGGEECTHAIEREEERKAYCQIKKTKQGEDCKEVRCDENNKKNQEEKTQASSRKGNGGMVVVTGARHRTESKSNKAGNNKDQKIITGPK